MSTHAVALEARKPIGAAALDLAEDSESDPAEARLSQLDSVDLDLPQADPDAQLSRHDAATMAADITALDPIRFIIDTVKRIETLLEQRHGAAGRGLHTKVDSVREALPADLVKQLRWIATMRNKTMHEDGFFPEDMPRLRKSMLDCVLRLEQSGNAAELPAPTAAPAEAAESPAVERAAVSGKRTVARRAADDDAGAASSEPKRPSAASAKRDARAAADAAVAFRRLLLGLAVCTAAALAIALI